MCFTIDVGRCVCVCVCVCLCLGQCVRVVWGVCVPECVHVCVQLAYVHMLMHSIRTHVRVCNS